MYIQVLSNLVSFSYCYFPGFYIEVLMIVPENEYSFDTMPCTSQAVDCPHNPASLFCYIQWPFVTKWIITIFIIFTATSFSIVGCNDDSFKKLLLVSSGLMLRLIDY